MKDQKKTIFISLGIASAAAVYIGYKWYQAKKQVIKNIDITDLQNINPQLLKNLYILATQRMPEQLKQMNSPTKLTFYSLFKQVNEGDADDLFENEEEGDKVKFNAWLQQTGKSMEIAMMEYIQLLRKFDKQYSQIVQDTVDGKIKEINVEDVQSKAGGALTKTVSKPKQQDESAYVESLTTNELDVFKIYKQIREDKDEELIKELINTQELSVTSKNKEGMTPLIFAVDCEFSCQTLEYLIEQGCDVNDVDADGRTPLHYALDLANEEIIRTLVNHGADPKIQDANEQSPLDECPTEFLEIIQNNQSNEN